MWKITLLLLEWRYIKIIFLWRKEPLYDRANPTVAPIRFSAQLYKPTGSNFGSNIQFRQRRNQGLSPQISIIRPPISPYFDPRRRHRIITSSAMQGQSLQLGLGVIGEMQSAPASMMGSVESSIKLISRKTNTSRKAASKIIGCESRSKASLHDW